MVAGGFGLTGAHASVANDDFASAATVGALPYETGVENAGATLQLGEPQSQCGTVTNTLWYSFTPSASGRFLADTMGADFNTILAVYEGSGLSSLTLIACSDDSAPVYHSRSQAYFRGVAGHTYFIQGGSKGGETGTLVLAVTQKAPSVAACAGCPAFTNYAVPESFANAHRAGETSIGVNPRTNAAMLLLLGQTLRVSWDEQTGLPTWNDVSASFLRSTADPILWTDQTTGRTFVAQLTAYVGSMLGFTDDDGATWTRTEPASVEPSWDHQTIGGGPYPAPLRGVADAVYPNALYYCAQPGVSANECARSDDGGLTWGPPAVMNLARCSGLHGHVVVGPDGTVYVPHKSCSTAAVGGRSALGLLASTNGGLTWETRTVLGTLPSAGDPKIGFDRGGRMYYAGVSETTPVVATSDDGGVHWKNDAPTVLGADLGVRNAEFPTVIGGDAGRAAVAFYGSTSAGDHQSGGFTDEWHLYISMTYNGGETWQTVDATPTDPIQRGCIWMSGGGNPCRNLLDFQDMTVDARGRVLVSYGDGCTTPDCLGPAGDASLSRDSRAVVARQTAGKGLYRAFD